MTQFLNREQAQAEEKETTEQTLATLTLENNRLEKLVEAQADLLVEYATRIAELEIRLRLYDLG